MQTLSGYAFNGAGGLELVSKDIRGLERGEVLLFNLTIGLNPVDYKLLGFFGVEQKGQILGVDGVGVVLESRHERVKRGQIYAYHANLSLNGSFATHSIISGDMCFPLSQIPAISELERAIMANLACENATSKEILQSIKRGLDSIKNADLAREYLTLAASLPCPALTAMQCLAKVPNLSGREVAIISAGGSVGRILSLLCVKSHAKVLAVCDRRHHGDLLGGGVSRCLDYDEFLSQNDCESKLSESWRVNENKHLDEVVKFYTIFDLQERIDSEILLAKLGYYGHLVSVVRRVESNPAPAFSHCPSLHEIALGAIYGYGVERDFRELQGQWEEIVSLTLDDSFRAILPPLEVVEFHQIPSALESLKKSNSGKKFVAWNAGC